MGTPRKAWAWLLVSAWLWPASTAMNKDKLRKRQREYAGIAVFAVTHSNEIVVKMKQSLAASKGWTFPAMEYKTWETCSPQCLPVCPAASPCPGGRMEGLLTPSLQADRNPTLCPRNPKYDTALQHRVQVLAAIVVLLQGSSAVCCSCPGSLDHSCLLLRVCKNTACLQHLNP